MEARMAITVRYQSYLDILSFRMCSKESYLKAMNLPLKVFNQIVKITTLKTQWVNPNCAGVLIS